MEGVINIKRAEDSHVRDDVPHDVIESIVAASRTFVTRLE